MAVKSQRFRPPLRVAKFLVSVLCHGFGIMAGFAERLPIVPIPEQFPISPMGNDMIHNCCLHITSFGKASDAKGMRLQVNGPCLLPSAPITFFSCGLGIPAMEGSVFFTVHGAIWNQPATTRMLTWGVWSVRHHHHFLPAASCEAPAFEAHAERHPHHPIKSDLSPCGTAV